MATMTGTPAPLWQVDLLDEDEHKRRIRHIRLMSHKEFDEFMEEQRKLEEDERNTRMFITPPQ